MPYFCLTLLEKAAHLVPKQVIISAVPICCDLFRGDGRMHTANPYLIKVRFQGKSRAKL